MCMSSFVKLSSCSGQKFIIFPIRFNLLHDGSEFCDFRVGDFCVCFPIMIGFWFQGRGGCTVEDFCNYLHRSLIKEVKYVLVWGVSARHYPQHCGLSHILQDEDVVQIVKKKVSFVYCLFSLLLMDTKLVAQLKQHISSKLEKSFKKKYEPFKSCNQWTGFCRRKKMEVEGDSNHTPRALLGFLTEKRRLLWRHEVAPVSNLSETLLLLCRWQTIIDRRE